MWGESYVIIQWLFMIQVKTKSLEFHKYTNRIHQHFQLHELQGLLDETPLERTPEISHSKVMCIKNRKKKEVCLQPNSARSGNTTNQLKLSLRELCESSSPKHSLTLSYDKLHQFKKGNYDISIGHEKKFSWKMHKYKSVNELMNEQINKQINGL